MTGQDQEQGQGDAHVDWQRNLIENYLKTHPEYVCVACLAQFIDVPASQISMLRHQLHGL